MGTLWSSYGRCVCLFWELFFVLSRLCLTFLFLVNLFQGYFFVCSGLCCTLFLVNWSWRYILSLLFKTFSFFVCNFTTILCHSISHFAATMKCCIFLLFCHGSSLFKSVLLKSPHAFHIYFFIQVLIVTV